MFRFWNLVSLYSESYDIISACIKPKHLSCSSKFLVHISFQLPLNLHPLQRHLHQLLWVSFEDTLQIIWAILFWRPFGPILLIIFYPISTYIYDRPQLPQVPQLWVLYFFIVNFLAYGWFDVANLQMLCFPNEQTTSSTVIDTTTSATTVSCQFFAYVDERCLLTFTMLRLLNGQTTTTVPVTTTTSTTTVSAKGCIVKFPCIWYVC